MRAETEGSVRPLPFGVDVAAYRIVQEALTNVARHAGPATATVRVVYGEDDVTVQVDDDGGGRPGAAQQPAAAATGSPACGNAWPRSAASLTPGPAPEGGFRVRARLPLDGRR